MSYYHLHPDQGMNFQMNRVLTYGEGAGRLEEIKALAARITDFASWFTEWMVLARRAEEEQRYLHAAYAYRMAEFFLPEGHPEKLACYRAFQDTFSRAVGEQAFERFAVPYAGSALPAMRLQAMPEKAVVVIHGGYDSFIEEFYLTVRTLPQHGYTVILFEGPGQGQALLDGLTFTHAWEQPAADILDFFQVSNVALLGISWGGYLALRAAAFEPRIQYVIAYDVCYDGFEVMTRPMQSPLKEVFQLLVRTHARSAVNALIERLRKRSLLLDWVVAQGMHITGAKTPFEYYQQLTRHTMQGISHLVRQGVFLLAGQRDHYIPLERFYCSARGDRGCQAGRSGAGGFEHGRDDRPAIRAGLSRRAQSPADLSNPSSKEVTVVEVPTMPFLMIDGAGNPNTLQKYQQAVEALYVNPSMLRAEAADVSC
jgi:pimeloyl-ACP methyl ester carboxylesterase